MANISFCINVINGVPAQVLWVREGQSPADVQAVSVSSFIEAMQLMEAVNAQMVPPPPPIISQQPPPPRVEKRPAQERTDPHEISTLVVPPESTDCPICFDTVERLNRVACGHMFCNDCLDRWANTASTCPLCRGDLDRSVRPRH